MNNSYLIYNHELKRENNEALKMLTYTPVNYLSGAKKIIKPMQFNNYTVRKATMNEEDVHIEDVDLYGGRGLPETFLTAKNHTYNARIKGVFIKKSQFDPSTDDQLPSSVILRQMAIRFDEMILKGEDGPNGNYGFLNNPNREENAPIQVGSGAAYSLEDLYNLIIRTITQVDTLTKSSGMKKVVLMSAETIDKLSNIYGNVQTYFSILKSVSATQNVEFRKFNEGVLNTDPAFLVLVEGLITYYQGGMPQLYSRGFNEEEGYYWQKYLMQSISVEIEKKGGLIYQPITFV